VKTIRPDEIYNLGAQSHVRVSFEIPEYTSDITGLGCIRLLDAIREAEVACRFYQASSSEMYGAASETPQTERTPFNPRSPYGYAKAFAFHATRNYREAYGMFAVNGILFNHESPRRGETFVTRKITRGVARIGAGLQDCLYLGNLAARRDWGFAGDYVQAMWLMVQAPVAADYVIATGETHSVREFCEKAFELADMPIRWRGAGLDEVGVDSSGMVRVRIDPRYFRPAEVDALEGDASYARKVLGWKPTVDFDGLVRMMVEADVALVRKEQK
jgi:GDPmannose 4,6-dehydratase